MSLGLSICSAGENREKSSPNTSMNICICSREEEGEELPEWGIV